MKYMGSKARIARHILSIILKNRTDGQWYVEPFAGGMNSIDKVSGNRIANDSNSCLIKMWKGLICGSFVPVVVSRELYNEIRGNKDNYLPEMVGWVGFNCSYSGKWFGGYAGETKTKIGTVRNYQEEAIRNIGKQAKFLDGVVFKSGSYSELFIPGKSIIYCDPPYEGTTKYKDDFDHDSFWDWCREKSNQGHTIFVSEYNAPEDFECVWEKEIKSSLSANGKFGASKKSVERLFTIKP